jgi:para-aminobenzoate synthetase component 1
VSARIQRLPYREDSAALFACVRDLPWPVFIDSARPMLTQGRYDIIAAAPYRTLTSRGPITEIQHAGMLARSKQDPFELIRSCLSLDTPRQAAELPFAGGAIGYFGYDLARRIERLPNLAVAEDSMPELAVGLYDWALVVDHATHSAWLVAEGRDPQTDRIWDSLVQRFAEPAPIPLQSFRLATPVHAYWNWADYLARFQRIQSYILEGDCYQVNLAQCFQAAVKGDPWSAYLRLRKINPAPFSAYLETPYGSVLSSSPERFLRLQGRQVQTCPIKGTALRYADPAMDRRSAEQLAASSKDRAENLMIVDLLRNDLGKVCETGSVAVSRLFEIQHFARVHHMVSSIEGRLATGEDALSLLRACFPGGSITGAPKLRAMQIIEELEGRRRGVYCGAIGYIGSDGGMDTNIAIRTLVVQHNRLRFWTGGAIVYDSDVEAEYQESLAKAAAIFDMLDAASPHIS